jgi:hypothetical protein
VEIKGGGLDSSLNLVTIAVFLFRVAMSFTIKFLPASRTRSPAHIYRVTVVSLTVLLSPENGAAIARVTSP